MFGFKAFATQPFASFTQAVQEIVTWGRTGGIGKKKIEKSKRAEIKEHIKALFEEPAVIEDIKQEIKEYAKPNKPLTVSSVDYSKLAQNVELANRILAKFQEMQQEQEDETVLLMLI